MIDNTNKLHNINLIMGFGKHFNLNIKKILNSLQSEEITIIRTVVFN